MTRKLIFLAFLVAALLGMAVHVAGRILERVHASLPGFTVWGPR